MKMTPGLVYIAISVDNFFENGVHLRNICIEIITVNRYGYHTCTTTQSMCIATDLGDQADQGDETTGHPAGDDLMISSMHTIMPDDTEASMRTT